MIQLIMIAGLVAAIGGGIWAFAAHERDIAVANEHAKVAAAQAEADRVRDAAVQQAENKITDMQAAYDAGEAKGRTLGEQIRAKGAGYVAANPNFNSVNCDIGPDLLRLVNASTGGMRTAAVTGGIDATVPNASPAAGQSGINGRASPAGGPQPGGAVGGVHPADGSIASPNPLSGSNLSGHPKPKPISQ